MAEQNQAPIKKSRGQRSAGYPAIPLEDAIAYSKKLVTAFTKSPFNRDNAVIEMGYKNISGASASRLAALVHYDLLTRGTGNTYSNSDLAFCIAFPKEGEDIAAMFKEAAIGPALFKKLLVEFGGKSLPTALHTILIRDYKISNNAAGKAAEVFRSTMEFVGLYQNGILGKIDVEEENPGSSDEAIVPNGTSMKNSVSSLSEIPKTVVSSGIAPAHVASVSPVLPAKLQMYTVTLPSGIAISYSEGLAYEFSMGTFREQIKALDDKISEVINKPKKQDDTSATNDASTE